MPSKGRLLLCYGHTSTLRAGQSLRGFVDVHRFGVLLVALILALFSAPRRSDRAADDRPGRGAADETGPDQPTEQRRVCSAPTAFPNSNFADKPWANDYLRISEAQKFATGAGITVAVIDTGVTGARCPRSPAAISSTRAVTACPTAIRTGRSPRRSSPAGPLPPTGSSASPRRPRSVAAPDVGGFPAGRRAHRPQ